MDLHGWVDAQLGGLGDFRLDHDGICQLRQGDDVDLSVEAHPGAEVALIHGPILRADPAGREKLLEAALGLNLLLVDGENLRVGYDRNLDSIVLVDTVLPGEVPTTLLRARLETFAEHIRSFREFLRPIAVSSGPEPVDDHLIFRG